MMLLLVFDTQFGVIKLYNYPKVLTNLFDDAGWEVLGKHKVYSHWRCSVEHETFDFLLGGNTDKYPYKVVKSSKK